VRHAVAAPSVCTGTKILDDTAVVIEDDRIIAVVPSQIVECPIYRLPAGATLAPGFIDLQVNGGGGVLLNDAITATALDRIAQAHLHAGTTAFLPTLISATHAEITTSFEMIRALRAASIIGLHVEGPYINVTRRGIHPASRIMQMRDEDVTQLASPISGRLLVTLAPECVPPGMLARLVQSGVLVFAGHSDATYDELCAAFDAGISGVTHLFNAMSQLGSRAPGVVGAALGRDCYASIIADGLHVDPANLAIAFKCKRADRLILISDAMATVASGTDSFTLDSRRITLREGRLADEAGTLAGAHLTMADAVRNCVELAGIPLSQAIRMASTTPADALRLPHLGRLRPGARADLVALDSGVRVIDVWQCGTRVHA
jgi:N-acetylglucosamine-6-phosphate deacetylase